MTPTLWLLLALTVVAGALTLLAALEDPARVIDQPGRRPLPIPQEPYWGRAPESEGLIRPYVDR